MSKSRNLATAPLFRSLVVLVVFGLASTSFATTINVDFGDDNPDPNSSGVYTGTAVAPDGGTKWNQVNVGLYGAPYNGGSFASGALVNSNSGSSSVTITLSNIWADFDSGWQLNPAGIAPALMNDGVAADSPAAMTLSINGLVSGGHYALYLYSQNGGTSSASTLFNFGVEKTATNSGNPASFTLGNNYVVYSDLVATGVTSGTISGSIANIVGGGSLNGFQIVSVPEPSSLGILATALLGLLAYAWRKRK